MAEFYHDLKLSAEEFARQLAKLASDEKFSVGKVTNPLDFIRTDNLETKPVSSIGEFRPEIYYIMIAQGFTYLVEFAIHSSTIGDIDGQPDPLHSIVSISELIPGKPIADRETVIHVTESVDMQLRPIPGFPGAFGEQPVSRPETLAQIWRDDPPLAPLTALIRELGKAN